MDPREHVVHFHDLKRLDTSPAHYLAALQNPSDSSRFQFGRLVHQTLLGGPPSAVWDGERRGNAWKEFKEANAHRDISTKAEVEKATRIANAVITHPIASQFLDGKMEVPVEWKQYGRKCATRGIDVLGRTFIADLKTTSTVRPYQFLRGAERYGYHAQLAMYLDAAASIGHRVEEAYVIAVETEPPYDVAVFRLTQNILEQGRRKVRLWFEMLRACEESNEWPGHTQSIVDWDVNEGVDLIIDGEEVAA